MLNSIVGFGWDENLTLRLMQTLLHFLWQGCLIAAVAVCLDVMVRRRSANARYGIHVASLVMMFACLPITYCLLNTPSIGSVTSRDSSDRIETGRARAFSANLRTPSSHVSGLSSDNRVEPVSETNIAHDRSAEFITTFVSPASDHARIGTELRAPANGAEVTRHDDAMAWLVPYAPYVSALYLIGVLTMTVRLLMALWGGRQLRLEAEPVRDRSLLAMVERQSRRLGLRIVPNIAYCREISVPVVMGVLKPMILLPASLASGLSADQLQALLTHELAHLRRLDPLVNLLQRVIEAVLFFHPAVWYISRRIDSERENASDDLVLDAGFPRIIYADALVRMAELSMSMRNAGQAGGVAAIAASGSSSSEFKRRVLRLLDNDVVHFRLSGLGLCVLLMTIATAACGFLFLPVWAASPIGVEAAASDDSPNQVGRKIEHFSSRDYLGTEHQLSEFSESRLIVVAFLGADCPLAKLYGPRLQELSQKYKGQRVAFIGVNSNQQDTPTDIGHYVRQHGIKFPLLKDAGNKIADQFQAERTPEVFVLDEQRFVRYWGAIDDQFGVGYSRPAATHQYVVAALDELLGNKAVSHPQQASVGCHIGRVHRKPPIGDITYSNQISRILQRRCIECHRDGGIAPFAMNSYSEVVGWAETMREVVADQRMPPWHANPKFGHFSNDNRMPAEEQKLLNQWIENGMPEGSPGELPTPTRYVEGWTLGRPDLIVSMPESFTVSRDGVVPYQYFTVDPGFKEGKWVRASEVRPGVRSVVHHVIVFINPPGGDPILEEKGVGFEMVGAYVPGTPPMQLEPGVARYVPAGSTFVFQLHYTPDGTERQDQSQIGLYFADPSTVRRTMQTGVAVNLDFAIPPEAVDYRVESQHRMEHDTEVYALTPHMHFRGKSFRFEAIYPNGSREILLDVPRFDFNWQNTYRLSQPKLLPEGTILRCTASFDNSKNNLSNPDPSIPVKWGEQTWEEMMIGYFEGVFLNQDLALPEPQITSLGDDSYRVRFTYRPDRPVRSVHVAGTFNEWNTWSHPLDDADKDGVFVAEVQLKSGPCRYKFLIDGNYWTHDPASRILTGIFHESFFVAGSESRR